MRNFNLTQRIWLMSFAASAISAAYSQGNAPAPNIATELRVPAAGKSIPEPSVGIPSEPLRVVCKGNQLTVAADNSTLENILNEVQKCSGAKIDIPNGAAEIRFFDTIGPLPIQEVLSTLLTASGYDFVIQSSDSDPGKVETVLLIARTESPLDAAGEHALTPGRRAFLKMRQDALTEAGITGDNSISAPAEKSDDQATIQSPTASAENAAASANAPSAANQASAASPAAASPQENSTAGTPGPEAAPSSSQPKTVEDQITNMEQMFQQRRQMMQSPPPSSPQL